MSLAVPAGITPEHGVPCVVAVAEGEPLGTSQATFPNEPERVIAWRPPADWVEWAAAKCEICPDGFIEDWDTGELDACPRCHNGRLLHEVRVRPKVAFAGKAPDPNDLLGALSLSIERAKADRHARTVLALLDVAPVHDFMDEPELVNHRFPHALVTRRAEHWFYFAANAGHGDLLTPAHVEALGPIEPGMFALVATVVDEPRSTLDQADDSDRCAGELLPVPDEQIAPTTDR